MTDGATRVAATPDAASPRLRIVSQLDAADVRRVLALAEAAAQVDGAFPLGEHVVLHLRHGDPGAVHLLAEDPSDGQLLGYGHLDCSEPAEGPAAELAVAPLARRRGVGRLLLDRILELAQDVPGPLRLWAHGAGASAGRLAATHGFHRIRNLLKLRRSLASPLDPVVLPAGVSLRPFDADIDTSEWLELNARAFAALPDQAGWTAEDLTRRMAQPWFDPAGFVLAIEHGRPVGFQWTKVHSHEHPTTGAGATTHDPIGEVYVLGIDPDHRGRGLGRALTMAGLHHLRATGSTAATLYVDAENSSALALYLSLGFAPWDSDTLFRR